MKQCSICNLVKPVTEFYEKIKGCGETRASCKVCDRLKVKQRSDRQKGKPVERVEKIEYCIDRERMIIILGLYGTDKNYIKNYEKKNN